MKFERVSKYPDAVLPARATTGSAGYDFTVAEDTFCPYNQVTYVPTGIKMQIDDGYELRLSIRSSSPKKYNVMLANGIGVIDSDYYNNPDNEGHMWIKFYNPTDEDYTITIGDKIAQGIFTKFLTCGDNPKEERNGGLGSTGK